MTAWKEHTYGGGCGVTLGRIVSVSVGWGVHGGYVVRVNDLRSKEGVRFDTKNEAKRFALTLARKRIEAALAELAELEKEADRG